MAKEEKRKQELIALEEMVKYTYLARNKGMPKNSLLGPVIQVVELVDHTDPASRKREKRIITVVTSISEADYDRITSDELFCFA